MNGERYIHYSKAPLVVVRPRAQRPHPEHKPRGLWFSAERDEPDWMGWREWCRAAEFATDRLFVRSEIVFRSDARLLRLGCESAIDAFHGEYSEPIAPTMPEYKCIAWRAVAKRWQGIIISPYCWARRLEGDASRWYYGWDCASGCVWDASAVEAVSVVQEVAA